MRGAETSRMITIGRERIIGRGDRTPVQEGSRRRPPTVSLAVTRSEPMALHKHRAHAIVGAVWMFGLAALFYTGRWWPGIMFVVGLSAIVEGLIAGQGWY